jgi:hypothetical protein
MNLKNPHLKPNPLPPRARILDRLEWVLQWFAYLVVIDIPDKPALSGLLTGIVMLPCIFLIAFVGSSFLRFITHWGL